jgi:hypothetical protein
MTMFCFSAAKEPNTAVPTSALTAIAGTPRRRCNRSFRPASVMQQRDQFRDELIKLKQYEAIERVEGVNDLDS